MTSKTCSRLLYQLTCGVQLLHHPFTWPHPCLQVAMMERVIRYGIDLGLTTVTIAPFGPTSFAYHIGNVMVLYVPAWPAGASHAPLPLVTFVATFGARLDACRPLVMGVS